MWRSGVRGICILVITLSTIDLICGRYEAMIGDQIWLTEGESATEVVLHLQKKGLADLIDISDASGKIRVKAKNAEAVKDTLLQEDVTMKVLVTDLAQQLREEAVHTRQQQTQQQQCTSISCPYPLTDAYMTHEQIEWYLMELNATYTDRVSVTSIGKSIQGRDIWQVHIQPRCNTSSAIWLEGGIHAREWISPAVTLNLIRSFIEDNSYSSQLHVYVVPIANPDGYIHTWTTDRYWRKNLRVNTGSKCLGVDLNRNWDFKFGFVGTSDSPCSDIFRGSSPFSEPETQALSNAMKIVSDEMDLLMVMTLHSYGQYLLYPWAWTRDEDAPDFENVVDRGNLWVNAVKQTFGTEYQLANGETYLYLASGVTHDWSKGVLEVNYSYSIELRGKRDQEFCLDPSNIQPNAQEVWMGMKALLPAIGPGK